MGGRRTKLLAARGIGLFVAAALVAQPPAAKLPVPDDAKQQAKAKEIGEVYKAEFDQAKSIDQKITLARKLMDLGSKTQGDAVERFMLIRVARDMSVKNGDLTTALEAIKRLEAEFAIDAWAMKQDAVSGAAAATKAPREMFHFRDQTAALVREAVAEDQYEVAKALLKSAGAKNATDPAFSKELSARTKEVNDLYTAYKQLVVPAQSVLESRASDPAANLAVGKFYCLYKGQWRQGAPMLALGSDKKLQEAAELELAANPDATKVADAWWAVFETADAAAKKQTQAHAAAWYWKSLPRVNGLAKSRAETRASSVPPIPFSEDAFAHLVHHGAEVRGDSLNLARDQRASTAKEYAGPVEVIAVARTHNKNIRLHGPRGACVIFNWEGNPEELRVTRPDGNDRPESGTLATARVPTLAPLVWYRLTWRLSANGMQVLVNDQQVFAERRQLDLTQPGLYRIAAVTDAVEVREFYVRSVTDAK